MTWNQQEIVSFLKREAGFAESRRAEILARLNKPKGGPSGSVKAADELLGRWHAFNLLETSASTLHAGSFFDEVNQLIANPPKSIEDLQKPDCKRGYVDALEKLAKKRPHS